MFWVRPTDLRRQLKERGRIVLASMVCLLEAVEILLTRISELPLLVAGFGVSVHRFADSTFLLILRGTSTVEQYLFLLFTVFTFSSQATY